MESVGTSLVPARLPLLPLSPALPTLRSPPMLPWLPALLLLVTLTATPPPPACAQDQADMAARVQAIMNEGLETCLVVVADTSGSMRNAPAGGSSGTSKISIARDALSSFVSALPDSIQMGMITFKGCRAQWVTSLGSQPKAAVLEKVAGMQASGSTPIVDSLKLARDALVQRRAKNPYGRFVIVLITDGEETCTAPALVGEVAGEVAQAFLELHVIGFDLGSEDTELKKVGAQYYQASDSRQLQEGLASVQGELAVDATVDTIGGGGP